jgi:glycosyltransferase involved in cell wall biosynthesis
MKIANNGSKKKLIWTINGRFATQQMTGVQRYAREIVRGIDEILSTDRDTADRLGFELVMPPCVQGQLALTGIAGRLTRFGSSHAWEQFVLPWYEKSGVLSLGNSGPAAAKCHVVCIHDANIFIQPESYSRTFRASYRLLLPLIGKRASKVATVSRFSADMLVKFGVSPRDKIFIAPNGHEHALRWEAARATLPLIKALKRPYVLLLGSKAKHKNIKAVLDGAEALDAAAIDIVVVGSSSTIFSNAPEVRRSNTHYTGYVSDDDLAALYRGALCLTFPSTTEGFGIPPLEAMASGCPVISSNAASLQEVGGDAVLYVDPKARADWRSAIIELSKNEGLRADLVGKGRRRAALFSWKRSAQQYIDEILQLGLQS